MGGNRGKRSGKWGGEKAGIGGGKGILGVGGGGATHGSGKFLQLKFVNRGVTQRTHCKIFTV